MALLSTRFFYCAFFSRSRAPAPYLSSARRNNMQLLQIAFAAAVVLSFGLLGRMMAMHDSLPSGPHTDHVDSSLHKILRQQRRLEDLHAPRREAV